MTAFEQHHKELEMEMLREIYSNVHEFVVEDPTVLTVLRKFEERSQFGMKHYGTSMADNPLDTLAWVEHAQQEAMDFVLYLERLKQEVIANGNRS